MPLEKYGVIYKITNNINQKVYIGQTIKEPIQRWYAHKGSCRSNKNKCAKLQRAWNKYGEDCWSFEVIFVAYSKEELDAAEIRFIKQYASNTCKGYNIHAGGWGGGKQSESTKKKRSDSLKKHYSIPENRLKCRPKTTRITSEETKRKISAKHKGKPLKHETNIKLGLSRKKFWKQLSLKEKQIKMAEGHEKMRDFYRKRNAEKYPLLLAPDGSIHKINCTIKEFCIKHNLLLRSFHSLLSGELKTHKKWKIYNEENKNL